jgi:hypothetical protein
VLFSRPDETPVTQSKLQARRQEAIFMNKAIDKLESVKAAFEHWR